jgi:hypothetical protein
MPFILMIFKFDISNNRKFSIYSLFLPSISRWHATPFNCVFRLYHFAFRAMCCSLIYIHVAPWVRESQGPIPFALQYAELWRG